MERLVEDVTIGETVIREILKEEKRLKIIGFYDVNGEGRGFVTNDQEGNEIRFSKACGTYLKIADGEEWLIEKRLPPCELEGNLRKLNQKYGGTVHRHKNGGTYVIKDFSVLSHNRIAEYAVNYYFLDVYDNRTDFSVKHTRPAKEFFDATRFKSISKNM